MNRINPLPLLLMVNFVIAIWAWHIGMHYSSMSVLAFGAYMCYCSIE